MPDGDKRRRQRRQRRQQQRESRLQSSPHSRLGGEVARAAERLRVLGRRAAPALRGGRQLAPYFSSAERRRRVLPRRVTLHGGPERPQRPLDGQNTSDERLVDARYKMHMRVARLKLTGPTLFNFMTPPPRPTIPTTQWVCELAVGLHMATFCRTHSLLSPDTLSRPVRMREVGISPARPN